MKMSNMHNTIYNIQLSNFSNKHIIDISQTFILPIGINMIAFVCSLRSIDGDDIIEDSFYPTKFVPIELPNSRSNELDFFIGYVEINDDIFISSRSIVKNNMKNIYESIDAIDPSKRQYIFDSGKVYLRSIELYY